MWSLEGSDSVENADGGGVENGGGIENGGVFVYYICIVINYECK